MENQIQLIQQVVNGSILTISVGKVPVINVPKGQENFRNLAPTIVNFLRSGCPKVQLVSDDGEQTGELHFSESQFNDLVSVLKELEQEDEEIFSYGFSSNQHIITIWIKQVK